MKFYQCKHTIVNHIHQVRLHAFWNLRAALIFINLIDAEQTHQSLIKYLLEESYEFVDAVDEEDRQAMREELGDILLQVYFHSRIAQEHPTDPFSIEEVAEGIVIQVMSNENPQDWLSKIKQYCDEPNDTNHARVSEVNKIAVEHEVDNYLASLLLASKISNG